MFTITPFTTQEPDLFDYFNAFDRCVRNAYTPQFAQCKTDICEQGDSFLLSAELPGFSREDITIDVKDNVLTIQAVHPKADETDSSDEASEADGKTEAQASSKINYIRRERHSCDYKRSFNIEGIDSDHIKASYTNGILELTLPKILPKEPAHIHIEVA